MDEGEQAYPCIGICMADPDSGYCLGCGRPPLPVETLPPVEAPPPVAPGVGREEQRTPPLAADQVDPAATTQR